MTKSHAKKQEVMMQSGGAAESFSGSVGVRELEGDNGESDGQGGDVCDGVEVFSAGAVVDPKSGLTGVLEASVIAFAFGAESIGALEGGTGLVDGKAVIVGDGDIPGTVASLFTVIPISVIAGA